MTKKIFQSILLVAGAVLLASLLIIMGFLYSYFGGVEENQLRDELSLASAAVESSGTDYLSQLTAGRYRLTWIAADGSVLYDTRTDAESLENHASRAEVSQALSTGTGESTRYSSTLMEKTMYYAQRLTDGTVLRISISRATVGMIAVGMLQPLLLVLIVALILSGVLARRLSRRIVDPLNSLDLEHPLDNDAYEELSPLLKRIHHQHVEIRTQLRELREKTDEFTQITGSMREGLVLLDEHGDILSINAAAQALFGADAQCVGRDFLTIERSHEISAAIQAAADDGHSEVRAERAGRIYQFDISRIASDGKTIGTVILAFDITEQEFAERNRREFTANVSHELKTPLQGIIGSAELIENGMVRPDDLPRFVGHIHTEAARLVTLIDDIIRLSQLDEGGELPTEPVDLLTVSQEAAETLQDAAAARQVMVSVQGEPTVIPGVRRLLYEIVYNLCDNAIKYNRPNGRIDTYTKELSYENGTVWYEFTITDTGVGMSEAFVKNELFRPFTQEKSDARTQYKGTGLGMSIVKELLNKLGGSIQVSSTLGQGTTFAFRLPFAVDTQDKETQAFISTDKSCKLAGVQVLLVEDNEINMEIAEFYLTERGAAVAKAWNGREAVEKVKAEPRRFDVVLMDVMMPVLDGLAATREIRALPYPAAGVPILAMTAQDTREAAQECKDAGMNDYLAKPVDPNRMAEKILHWTRQQAETSSPAQPAAT